MTWGGRTSIPVHHLVITPKLLLLLLLLLLLHESEKRDEGSIYLVRFPSSLEYIQILNLPYYRPEQALRAPEI